MKLTKEIEMRGPQYERALTAMLLFVDRDDHDEFLFDLDASILCEFALGASLRLRHMPNRWRDRSSKARCARQLSKVS